MLDRLRDIRNDAAHEAVFNVESSDLQVFHDLGTAFPDSFPASLDMKNTDSLKFICQGIVFGFWMRHAEIFGKVLPY